MQIFSCKIAFQWYIYFYTIHTVKSENKHTRVDIFFHVSSHYIFLFMDCTAISDMTVHPFLTQHDAETSVLWKT